MITFCRGWKLIASIAGVACLLSIRAAETLFNDPVIVKAKSFQIRESELHDMYLAQKAAAVAVGQPTPPALEGRIKQQLLEKMIATRLFLSRATAQDLDEGKKIGQKILAETKQKSGSESAYRRRLYAMGTTPEKFEAEIQDQAIVQAVIDREIKRKQVVTESEIKKYYDEHPDLYEEAEKGRVLHILFATRKIPSGEPLPIEQRLVKKAAADKAVVRARAGEDFAKLIAELSEDPEKSKGGEISFTKGAGTVPPQFESAALSLQVGQISDPVLSVFGYHIIKLLEKTPAGKIPLDKVHDRISEYLLREMVQKKVPDLIAQLRKDAGVQVIAAE